MNSQALGPNNKKTQNTKCIVGCVFDEMAKDEMGFLKFCELCKKHNLTMKEIDVNSEIEPQGPFSLIIYRSRGLADLVGKMKENDPSAINQFLMVKKFLKSFPEIRLLDPISTVLSVADRGIFCSKLDQVAESTGLFKVPKFIRMEFPESTEATKRRIKDSSLSYPIFAKPALSYDHNLILILDQEGLGQLSELRHPLLLQQFISHNGVLHKIGVIGQHTHVSLRASVRNLPSNNIKYPHCIKISTVDINNNGSLSEFNSPKEEMKEAVKMDKDVVGRIVEKMRDTFGLSLFGVDIIVEKTTGHPYIIDINYFPSFQQTENVPEKLLEHIKNNLPQGIQPHHQKSKL